METRHEVTTILLFDGLSCPSCDFSVSGSTTLPYLTRHEILRSSTLPWTTYCTFIHEEGFFEVNAYQLSPPRQRRVNRGISSGQENVTEKNWTQKHYINIQQTDNFVNHKYLLMGPSSWIAVINASSEDLARKAMLRFWSRVRQWVCSRT